MTEMRGRSRGFTLIEVVIVAGLVGIIASAALAPLVFTVKSLEEAERSFRIGNKERNATRRIFNDVRGAGLNAPFLPFKLSKDGGLASRGPLLMVWSSSAGSGAPALVVYRALADDGGKTALYRWVIPDGPGKPEPEKPIMELDPSLLEEDDAVKVAGGLSSVAIRAFAAGEWAESYTGAVPAAVRIDLERNGKTERYEEWFPNS